MKRRRECEAGAKLELQALLWRDFPLSSLEARMKCPTCGSHKVPIMYDVPPATRQVRAQLGR